MSSRNYAYLRVSSKDQNIDRQLDAIRNLNVAIDERDIYIDKESGKNFERPEWQALKRSIRAFDCLYIKELDRLGRNKAGIKSEWKWLMDNKVNIVIIDMPLLDTRKYKDLDGIGELVSNLVLEILSWLAEEERLKIKQRQKEGIYSAKMRKVKFGRPSIEINDNFIKTYQRWKSGEITAVKAMELTGFKKTSFYNKVKMIENKELIKT